MNTAKLQDMIGGWFVGAFAPTALTTNACEVAVKTYAAGAREQAHYHAVATEVTLVLSGSVRMCNKEWGEGGIVVLSPNEVTDFEALSDAVCVVVKVPGVLNDKYLVPKKMDDQQ